MRSLQSLGTADPDAAEIESKAVFSVEELKRKAEAARLRRVEAGVDDTVENMNPLQPPVFDQSLVGKEIEVLWKYHHAETSEPMYIWTPGV